MYPRGSPREYVDRPDRGDGLQVLTRKRKPRLNPPELGVGFALDPAEWRGPLASVGGHRRVGVTKK